MPESGVDPCVAEFRKAVRIDADTVRPLRDADVVEEHVDRDRVCLLDDLALSQAVELRAAGAVWLLRCLNEPLGQLGVVDSVAREGGARGGYVALPEYIRITVEARATVEIEVI